MSPQIKAILLKTMYLKPKIIEVTSHIKELVTNVANSKLTYDHVRKTTSSTIAREPLRRLLLKLITN